MHQAIGKKPRAANVELFRCLLMFLIVLGHAYGRGPVGASDSPWTILFTCLLAWHVDGFLAISGWFGISFSWKKLLRLYGLIFFYSVLSFLYAHFVNGASWTSFRVTGGWFGNTYVMLMMFSPLLNLGIDALCRRSRREVLSAWLLLAGAMLLKFVPIVGLKPHGTGGFTIITFIFIYVTARLLCHAVDEEWLPVRWFVRGALGVFALGVLALCVGCWGHLDHYPLYDSPHVYLMALAMLLVFVKFVRVSESIGRFVGWISPSMFAVYLIHNVASFGPSLYQVPQRWLLDHTAIHPILIVFLTAMTTFVLCTLLDLLRRLTLSICARALSCSRGGH